MSQAGIKLLAQWRETFGWWNDEPVKEFIRGIKNENWHQAERSLGQIGNWLTATQSEYVEDLHDDWPLQRERKIRDEKVSAATGNLPSSYYDRKALESLWTVDSSPHQGRQASKPGPLGYVPLHVLSGYSFGRSILLCEEIASYCAQFGCHAAALVDRFALTGAIEFSRACRRNNIKPLIGISIEVPEGGELVLIAKNRVGYQNLCQLVATCHLDEPRLFPLGTWERLEKFKDGLLCLTGGDIGPLDHLLVKEQWELASVLVERLIRIYGNKSVFIEVDRTYLPWTVALSHRLRDLADRYHLTRVAGGLVTHARPSHFPAQDVAWCAHSLAMIAEPIGRKPLRDETQPQGAGYPYRALNAERFLRTGHEMQAHYADEPQLLAQTLRVAEMCDPDVLPRRAQLPQLFEDDNHALREIVTANAFGVYPQLTNKHKHRLKHEVDRITRLGFATHFLIASEMCRWAGEQGIHLSGRGSAVDSAVAYVLGFSRIDAIQHQLHFDRFLPPDGSKRPDIDIDFEAHRRDDVRGYLINRFGVEHTAQVSAIGSYRVRGILRQVGKVMGLSDEAISFLAKRVHGGVAANQLESALERRPELRDSNVPKARLKWVFKLAEQLMDVPFDIGCHSSGLVIAAQPIREFAPIMRSGTPSSPYSGTEESHLRILQWDKRSAKYVFDKFDILCLRGQDVISGTEDRVRLQNKTYDAKHIDVHNPEIYRAMKSGELIGIPQSASPAMRQAHIRLRTENLHDASLVQAGIRPGVGGAVKINELIARRRGKPYSFEHPDFERILGMTYGIIVFQEQVDQILQTFCAYTAGEAEDIRDTIHKRRREDFGAVIHEKVIERVLSNGYSVVVAEKVYEYVSGFKGYGFAQGHALAFAEISLRCVHLMQNEPTAYFASLLSAQPAGYYGPCTIANEARIRGVEFLSPSVCTSENEFTVADGKPLIRSRNLPALTVPQGAIQVGLMQIATLSQATKERILERRRLAVPNRALLPLPTAQRPLPSGTPAVGLLQNDPDNNSHPAYQSFFDFVAQVQPDRNELEALILTGACDDFSLNRRAMLWAIPDALEYGKILSEQSRTGTLALDLVEPQLPLEVSDFNHQEKAVYERQILGMDVQRHLMSFERPWIEDVALTTQDAKTIPVGSKAVVVGNPIRLRFPPTASGKRVVFFDLEDETGILNVTAFDDVYQRDGKAIVTSPYVTIRGICQDRDGHKAFLAQRVFPYRPQLMREKSSPIPIKGADFLCG